MSKTGCKYECRFDGKNRIRCGRDGSIRVLKSGCMGAKCPNYKPIWWKNLFSSKVCKRCLYYEQRWGNAGICRKRNVCRYYTRGDSKACSFWEFWIG